MGRATVDTVRARQKTVLFHVKQPTKFPLLWFTPHWPAQAFFGEPTWTISESGVGWQGPGSIHRRWIPRPGGSRVRHPDRKANPELDKVIRFRSHSLHRDRCSRTDDTRQLFHVKHAYAPAGLRIAAGLQQVAAPCAAWPVILSRSPTPSAPRASKPARMRPQGPLNRARATGFHHRHSGD